MRKSIIAALLMCTMCAHAAAPADTIPCNYQKIEKCIADETKNTKGNKVVKYYFIYNKQLISTSRTVYEKYMLCKKYGAQLNLAIVKRGSNQRIIIKLYDSDR